MNNPSRSDLWPQFAQIMPGLQEAVAAAFLVPAGPAMLLSLVLQEVQQRFVAPDAGRNGPAIATSPATEEGSAGDTRMVDAAAMATGGLAAARACANDTATPAHPQPSEPAQLVQGPSADQLPVTAPQDKTQAVQPRAGDEPDPVERESHPESFARHQNTTADPPSSLRTEQLENSTHDLNKAEAWSVRVQQDAIAASDGNQMPPARVWEPAHRTQLEISDPNFSAPTAEPHDLAAPACAAAGAISAQQVRSLKDILNLQDGKLFETLDGLATETRQRQQQTLAMIEFIVASHASFAHRLAQLEAQLATQRNTQISG